MLNVEATLQNALKNSRCVLVWFIEDLNTNKNEQRNYYFAD